MRNIIPISGKDSLATALLQRELDKSIDYEYVFNPTGAELPEVFEWIKDVESFLGKEIVMVGRDLEDIIIGYNFYLPSGTARYCTRQSKIEPFQDWIGIDFCNAYFGIRADEWGSRDGFNNKTAPNITPIYPLVEYGIGLEQVYQMVNHVGLKPPTFFWERLYSEVESKIGSEILSLIPEWKKDILFSWRSRANCYFCFNQRTYELVGLLEHHPELFDKMQWYEHQDGDEIIDFEEWKANVLPDITKSAKDLVASGKTSISSVVKSGSSHEKNVMWGGLFEGVSTSIKAKGIHKFNWRDGYPCWLIRELSEIYFQKRVREITSSLLPKTGSIFHSDNDFIDTLSVKSCGLFCGK